jgi:DNA polymerase kappa
MLPQPADERTFNEHIDACLSRRTIKEIVREPVPSTTTAVVESYQSPGSRKRGRAAKSEGADGNGGEKRARGSFFT